jgi:signal transduction histidine kinase
MVKESTSQVKNIIAKFPLRWQLILLIFFVFLIQGTIFFVSISALIQSSVFFKVPVMEITPISIKKQESEDTTKSPNPIVPLNIESMESEALIRLQTRLQKMIFFTLVGSLLMGLILSFFLSKKITDPIEKLSRSISLGTKKSTESLSKVMPSQELSELHSAIMLSLSRFENQLEKQNQFMLDVAHEFRTPVASIRMKIDVVKKKTNLTPEDCYSLCATIDRSAVRLEQLIDKLKCLSSDYSVIVPSMVNIKTLVEESVELLLPLSKEKSVEVKNMTESEHILNTEVLFLQTIITNIIENSIMYNKHGGQVVISSNQSEEGCEILVVDNGIGIDKEDIGKIFNRFYRVDKSRSRQTGGSGLGLPIVKTLLNQIGGRISMSSILGEGTEVKLFIPNYQEDFPDARKELKRHEEL